MTARESVVRVETADSYFVRPVEGGHARGWARIFVQSGRGEATWWCQVSVLSDWGNFGHVWSSCGSPPERFLADLDYDYAMGKFMPQTLKLWDSDAYVRELRRRICELRRDGSTTKLRARACWQRINELEDDSFDSRDLLMGRLLDDSDVGRVLDFEAITGTRGTVDNPQALGFWRYAWPLFIDALKARAAAQEGVCHEG